MKKLFLSLLAMGMLVLAPATSVASDNNITVKDCPNGVKNVDPKALTDKLVKDLNLNESQAKELSKLNTEYADVLVCPHAKSDCKMADGACKKADGECKKGEAMHCDKQGKAECKGEAKHCDKQGKAECKGEGAKCDMQKKPECPQQKEMMAKRTAYLDGLKKILTDSQYQQYLNM